MAQDSHAGHGDHAGHGEVASATDVTEAEMTEFVALVLRGRGVQNDETLSETEQQAAFLALISESDMGMARFMAVSQAIGEDEALQAEVQQRVMNALGAQ
ncbi:hypothetical protein AAW01_12135 [Aurantiacibacter gangjinensis]|uniref:Uncharacterized protein n=2 Tax=Aurantiacibacter gangjinensis TaxID=502682 RepID=A0A0G9MNI2_9SPHN|nr:hypothetical protein AAW01_12135 [Aurantiacibacter gangjinensis]